MPDTRSAPENNTQGGADAKSHFTKALDEAKAGAEALGKEAMGRAGEYRDQYRDKLNQKGDDIAGQARARSGEARDRAYQYAADGKGRASKVIADLGKLLESQGDTIDGTVGHNFGDYARSAGRTVQDTAARLDEKSLEELGEDTMEFVRQNPALAVGMAAAAGYMMARLFSRK